MKYATHRRGPQMAYGRFNRQLALEPPNWTFLSEMQAVPLSLRLTTRACRGGVRSGR